MGKWSKVHIEWSNSTPRTIDVTLQTIDAQESQSFKSGEMRCDCDEAKLSSMSWEASGIKGPT